MIVQSIIEFSIKLIEDDVGLNFNLRKHYLYFLMKTKKF